jgi:hypothetical protein
MILPFVRERIDGATPLHLFDSPQPGSGKTLLAGVITIPSLGSKPAATTEVANADDLRKSVTALSVWDPTRCSLDHWPLSGLTAGERMDYPSGLAAPWMRCSSQWARRGAW